MVDVAAVSGGYYSDQARTYSVGPASERARAQFRVACAVQSAMLAALRPGVTPAQLYAVGEEVVSQAHPPYFAAGELSLPGFAGHGLGLESDEPPVIWPRATEPLQAGMVLAIEIEVVSPDLGTIKLEDTAIVTGGEPEIPTLAPRELIEVDYE
jgi:Xaa-Pro aminopeptidase